ncbi:hypothetical protein MMPV_002360 [Pyropia vietnamensis]
MNTFILHYRSGWRTAYAHHRVAPGGAWTALPGTRLTRAAATATTAAAAGLSGGATTAATPAAVSATASAAAAAAAAARVPTESTAAVVTGGRTLGPDWHRLDVVVAAASAVAAGGALVPPSSSPVAGLELVLTDGAGSWDHPSRECPSHLTAADAKHYFLPAASSSGSTGGTAAAEYVLSSGCVSPVVDVATAAALLPGGSGKAPGGSPGATTAGATVVGGAASAATPNGHAIANGNDAGDDDGNDGGVDGVTTPVLLVTDLDGTLLGDAAAGAAFVSAWRRIHAPAGGVLVYNTGRSVCSVVELLAKAGSAALETPAAVICAVGSEVYWYHPVLAAVAAESTGGVTPSSDSMLTMPVRDLEWEATLGVDGWDRSVVMAVASSVVVDTGLGHWRPDHEQTAYKIVLSVTAKAVGAVMDAIRAQLEVRGIAVQLICCGEGDWRYVDVASTAAGKWAAMAYVRRRLAEAGVGTFSAAQTLVAGDSGNDVAMFAGGTERGVVVGNAQAELLDWLAAECTATKGAVDRRVVHAEGRCAAGILEGLRRLRMV